MAADSARVDVEELLEPCLTEYSDSLGTCCGGNILFLPPPPLGLAEGRKEVDMVIHG